MKIKSLLIGFAGVTAMLPAYAGNLYVSGQVGITKTNDADWKDSGFSGEIKFDDAVNYGIAVGTNIMDNVRAEVELSHREADNDEFCADGFGCGDNGLGGELKTTLLLANFYYDFMAGEALRPYVSAGVGAAYHDGELSASDDTVSVSESGDDTVFAYQLGLGISYDISEDISLAFGYRYLSSSDPSFDSLDAEYDANEWNLSVRFNF